MSVGHLVSEPVPLAVGSDAVAELDWRWAAIEAGEPTISHDEVVRWLKTWGTPGFRP